MTEKVRNVLLFGRTGNGKSTVANILANEVNENETEFINFEEKFKESAMSVSETKEIQTAEFEENVDKDGTEKIKFRIIDTIGVSDTVLGPREVMSRIAKIADIIKEDGLTRILFIVKGRFTKEEIEAYNLLRAVIFDADIIKYTTVVRTGFGSFRNLDKCMEDKNLLLNENQEIAEIVSNKIIYVNNPPVDTGDETDDANNMRARVASKKLLRTHLYTCKDQFYKPSNLDSMNERISEYKTESERNAEMVEEFTKKLAEEKEISRIEREEMAKKIEEANRAREQAAERMNQELARIMKENQENFNRAMKEQRENYDRAMKRAEDLAREKASAEAELARQSQRESREVNYNNSDSDDYDSRPRRRGGRSLDSDQEESSPDNNSDSDDYDSRRGGGRPSRRRADNNSDSDDYDSRPRRRGGSRRESSPDNNSGNNNYRAVPSRSGGESRRNDLGRFIENPLRLITEPLEKLAAHIEESLK